MVVTATKVSAAATAHTTGVGSDRIVFATLGLTASVHVPPPREIAEGDFSCLALVALRIVLAVGGIALYRFGLLLVVFIRQDHALSIMLSLYVTLGIFPLLAIRDPSASRSVPSQHGRVSLMPRSPHF